MVTEPIGNRVRARVVKNKTAAPFRNAEFDIMFDEGISTTGDLIDLACEDGIVAQEWFMVQLWRYSTWSGS